LGLLVAKKSAWPQYLQSKQLSIRLFSGPGWGFSRKHFLKIVAARILPSPRRKKIDGREEQGVGVSFVKVIVV
jgi:hypothetical protein